MITKQDTVLVDTADREYYFVCYVLFVGLYHKDITR